MQEAKNVHFEPRMSSGCPTPIRIVRCKRASQPLLVRMDGVTVTERRNSPTSGRSLEYLAGSRCDQYAIGS